MCKCHGGAAARVRLQILVKWQRLKRLRSNLRENLTRKQPQRVKLKPEKNSLTASAGWEVITVTAS